MPFVCVWIEACVDPARAKRLRECSADRSALRHAGVMADVA